MKLSDTNPEQQRRIAALVASATGRPTTANSLRHAAKGRVGVSAEMATAIEHAAKNIGLDIRREDLSAACGRCEFAKACRKGAKT